MRLPSLLLLFVTSPFVAADDYPEMGPKECTFQKCGTLYRSENWSPDFEANMKQALEFEFTRRFPEAELGDCENFVHLPVGVARGNHSYGATCNVKLQARHFRYTMCTSVMVEHFALTRRYLEVNEVAVFTYLHCTGG